jgi:hypothetical protein
LTGPSKEPAGLLDKIERSGKARPGQGSAGYCPASNTRYTDARPILRALAISVAPRPCDFIARTWTASIEAGRPL